MKYYLSDQIKRWERHVARLEARRGENSVLVGKPEGKKPLEDQGIDGRIILTYIFRKRDGCAYGLD
jgi:hypothetical protein